MNDSDALTRTDGSSVSPQHVERVREDARRTMEWVMAEEAESAP